MGAIYIHFVDTTGRVIRVIESNIYTTFQNDFRTAYGSLSVGASENIIVSLSKTI